MTALPSISSASPAVGAFAITPNDSTDLAITTRGIYVGVAGDLKVDMNGTAVTFVDLAAGIIHPIVTTRVYDTGTSAGSIIGLY